MNHGSQAIAFTDRNGLPLGTLLSRDQEHTAAVPLDRVSADFLNAIIAAEDGRFYRHGAVEPRAVARALWQLVSHREVVSGASTVQMQLARMIDPVPSTIAGKLREIWVASRLEAGMDKPEILDAYVNRLPMGGNLYGVEAAAQAYFGEPASELDLAQASLLAAIPNDPPRLEPYGHWAALKRRQGYVLDRMVADAYVSRAQAERAACEHVRLQSREQTLIAAPHLMFWLAAQLPPATNKVRTTLDRPLQQFVEEQIGQVVSRLAQRNVHEAAALVVDNRSGDVLAYAGSAGYFDAEHQGSNDGIRALRQPGSTLKPFLYELALETRVIRPNTILADVPTRYPIPGALLYSPEDYSDVYQGPVRVRIALADSLNVPAVRVLAHVGVPAFLDRLHQLGFSHLQKSPDFYGLGLTLGAGEVSLWELAHAYVTIARRGNPVPLRTVIDAAPGPPPADSTASRFVGDGTAWALVTSILADGHARAKSFGVGSVLDVPFDAAVKTGTSSDFRDTWTVGFTSDYTVAVWVGNFDGQPMRQIAGVTGAAPLWNRIIMHLHERSDPAPFDAPGGLVARPICATTGWRPTPDCESVVREYFYPDELAAYDRATRVGELPHAYDEWRAMQQPVAPTLADFRILYPRAGDEFVIEPVDRDSAVVSLPQALEFVTAAPRGAHVAWRLNGKPLAGDAATNFWALRVGTWTLQASTAGRTDRVTFSVERAGVPGARRGFSVSSRNP